jgi:hypothetical protein
MELYVDNRRVDLSHDAAALRLGLTTERFLNPAEAWPRSMELLLPLSRNNMEIFGEADIAHSRAGFNAELHTARVEAEGHRIAEGEARLAECVTESADDYKKGYLRIEIVERGPEWVRRAAERRIDETPVEDGFTLTESEIKSRWAWKAPIQFFPVQRRNLAPPPHNTLRCQTLLGLEDFHPFLRMKEIVEAIFLDAGYTVNSAFIDSPLFRQLYISGNHAEPEVSETRRMMDFKAGRYGEKRAVAGADGKIYTTPPAAEASLGNIVETAYPGENAAGERVEGVFNTNGVFRILDGHAAFATPRQAAVGFEYELRYRSDYCIASRTSLRCFDAITLGDGAVHHFEAGNPFEDKRQAASFNPGMRYRLIIFDFPAGFDMRLTFSTAGEQLTFTVAERATAIDIPWSAAGVTAPQLLITGDANTPPVNYNGDWALYGGSVAERGEINIAATLREAQTVMPPLGIKYFDDIVFGGGEQGMGLTLCAATTLRPVFSPYPSIGSAISFGQVANCGISQMEFIASVQRMFNLAIHTNEISRTVCIEPRDEELVGAPVTDVERLGTAATVETLGEMAETVALGYGDHNAPYTADGTTLGQWRLATGNRFARTKEHRLPSPLFAPSATTKSNMHGAPNALLLEVGDHASGASGNELNFPVKAAAFAGMAELPDGEGMAWAGRQERYPLYGQTNEKYKNKRVKNTYKIV